MFEHFDRRNLVYDKFNNNFDLELFNENIFSLQKLKDLKNTDYLCHVTQTAPFILDSSVLEFDSRFESGNLSLASYVDNVYTLLLHNDVNTSGYTSWFYFEVKAKTKGLYKFAILNYGKAGKQLNSGVQICVKNNKGWQRGGQNVTCQPNSCLFNKGKFEKFNTLSFEYFLEENEQVRFAYNVPYTYSDLCTMLDGISQRKLPIVHRKLAGLSLAGNRIE